MGHSDLPTNGARPSHRLPRTTSVGSLEFVQSPTEVDHYQIQRVADVYVTPSGEDLNKVTDAITRLIDARKLSSNVRINLRGMVQGMRASFKSFAIGLSLSVVLLFLILVAQFRSFKDPFLIMLAIPMGFIGVLIVLPLTHTTLNVMSLMGVLMLVGISASNSILIVEFAHRLEEQGHSVRGCRDYLLPRPPASHPDDLARDHYRHGADGAEAGYRKRTVCAAGSGHYRRIDGFGPIDCVHCAGRVPAGVPQPACAGAGVS